MREDGGGRGAEWLLLGSFFLPLKSQKRCVLLRGPIYNQAGEGREEGALYH